MLPVRLPVTMALWSAIRQTSETQMRLVIGVRLLTQFAEALNPILSFGTRSISRPPHGALAD